MSPKCRLILDLDDTIIPSTLAYRQAYQACNIDENSENFKLARNTVKTRLTKNNPASHNRFLYFKTYLEILNQLSPRKLFEICNIYETELANYISEFWKNSKSKDFFLQLQSQNIPYVLLTNENTRTQMLKINAIDADGSLFPNIITSEEYGMEKPNIELFKAAAKSLNCELHECTMLGDSWENDIHPMIQFGGRSIWTNEFLPFKNVPAQDKVKQIKSLRELHQNI